VVVPALPALFADAPLTTWLGKHHVELTRNVGPVALAMFDNQPAGSRKHGGGGGVRAQGRVGHRKQWVGVRTGSVAAAP
jgi:hypothetical protein